MYRNMYFAQIASAPCNRLNYCVNLRQLRQLRQFAAFASICVNCIFGFDRRSWLPLCGRDVPVQLPYCCTVCGLLAGCGETGSHMGLKERLLLLCAYVLSI